VNQLCSPNLLRTAAGRVLSKEGLQQDRGLRTQPTGSPPCHLSTTLAGTNTGSASPRCFLALEPFAAAAHSSRMLAQRARAFELSEVSVVVCGWRLALVVHVGDLEVEKKWVGR
jgi:hypothetical protein